VAIIHRGRTLAAGPVAELLDRVASDRVRITARPARLAAEMLAAFGAVEPPLSEGEGVVAARISKQRVPEAVRSLAAAGVDVFAVERPLSSLEEVFLEITGGETV
jgi:ABC-type multidrug transport system ATPase subunit